MCICVSDEALPPAFFFFFFNRNDLILPPPIWLIISGRIGLLLFSSFPLSLCLYHQSAPNWFFYQTNSIPSPREARVSEGAAWKRDARYENKEAARSTHTGGSEVRWRRMTSSFQSWSHRSHAALIHLTSTPRRRHSTMQLQIHSNIK